MKITTASIAIIAFLASHADHVLARNGRTLKSSKAGGRGKGELKVTHLDRMLDSLRRISSSPPNLPSFSSGSTSSCGSGKGSKAGSPTKDQMTAEAKCAVFQSYHDSEVYIAQKSDRRLLAADDIDAEAAARLLFPDTPVLCDAFDPVDPYLCPGGPRIAKICTQPRIDTNVAVKKRYCEPLFRDICDDEERDECVRRCVQYVSPSQGDCCGISSVDCDDYPISTSSSSSGKGSKNDN